MSFPFKHFTVGKDMMRRDTWFIFFSISRLQVNSLETKTEFKNGNKHLLLFIRPHLSFPDFSHASTVSVLNLINTFPFSNYFSIYPLILPCRVLTSWFPSITHLQYKCGTATKYSSLSRLNAAICFEFASMLVSKEVRTQGSKTRGHDWNLTRRNSCPALRTTHLSWKNMNEQVAQAGRTPCLQSFRLQLPLQDCTPRVEATYRTELQPTRAM